MDRTPPSEGGDTGSIPVESTKGVLEFCALKRANCFARSQESKGGTMFG